MNKHGCGDVRGALGAVCDMIGWTAVQNGPPADVLRLTQAYATLADAAVKVEGLAPVDDRPDRESRMREIQRRLLEHVEANPGASGRELEKVVRGRASEVREALHQAEELGMMQKRDQGNLCRWFPGPLSGPLAGLIEFNR